MGSEAISRQCYRRSSTGPHLEMHHESISITKPTQAIIKSHAVSLNFRDANMVYGQNPWPIVANGVPCSDVAGEIVQIGTSVKNFNIGDRVIGNVDQANITGREHERCWLAADVDGVLADYVIFEEKSLVAIPEWMPWNEASLLPCAGLTAWAALKGMEIGNCVLIQGTGGVSMCAVRLARTAGCKVILTSSSDTKLEKIKSDYQQPPLLTINYKNCPNWHEKALEFTNGKGVDLLLENGGMSSVLQSIKATRRGGTVSVVGYLGEQNPALMKELLSILIDRRVNLRGINAGSTHDLEDLVAAVSANRMVLKDDIDSVFPFEKAEEGLKYLLEGKMVGKIVIEF